MSDKQKAIEEMAKALRAHCPNEDILDEIPFDLYAANMVIYGYGNVRQALTEFATKIKHNIIKGDGDEEEDAFTRGYNCACDSHTETIDKILKEFLE